MENKKLKIALGILFAVFVIIFASNLIYLNIRNKSTDKKTSEVVLSETRGEPKSELQLQEQMAEIIKAKDLSGCEEIKDETYKKVCINNISMNLAQENQDISYCQKLDNSLIPISECESPIITKKSLNSENIDVCGETSDKELQKQCQNGFWPALALKKEDVNLCNNIQAENEKNLCRDQYVFQKEFIKSEDSFTCTRFSDKQIETDCGIYQKNSEKTHLANCSEFKSFIFSGLCMKNSTRAF